MPFQFRLTEEGVDGRAQPWNAPLGHRDGHTCRRRIRFLRDPESIPLHLRRLGLDLLGHSKGHSCNPVRVLETRSETRHDCRGSGLVRRGRGHVGPSLHSGSRLSAGGPALRGFGDIPPTPWGTFVWIAFYIGLPTGVLVLGLALTDRIYLMPDRKADAR